MKLKERIDGMLTWLMAGCAVTATVLLIHRELTPAPDPNAPRAPVEVKNWRTYATGDKRIGPEIAPVTIVEFSDFQCPFCAQLFRTIEQLRATRPKDIAIVYRNFPLQIIHPQSRPAALAAECAATQTHFPEYYSFLFQHQDSLGTIPWVSIAKRVGIQDTSQFSRCLSSSAAIRKLREDSTAGESLKISGTPTIIINGWMIAGSPSPADLDSLVNVEFKRARHT